MNADEDPGQYPTDVQAQPESAGGTRAARRLLSLDGSRRGQRERAGGVDECAVLPDTGRVCVVVDPGRGLLGYVSGRERSGVAKNARREGRWANVTSDCTNVASGEDRVEISRYPWGRVRHEKPIETSSCMVCGGRGTQQGSCWQKSLTAMARPMARTGSTT